MSLLIFMKLCSISFFAVCALLTILGTYNARGMDRWTALSQIESGNRDDAIGLEGEVSRYQIKPRIWIYMHGGDPTDPVESLRIAKKIMAARTGHFRARFKRSPGTFEFYVLWNAPGQIDDPSEVVRERAVRYRNLREMTE